jgi:hypothetical protein
VIRHLHDPDAAAGGAAPSSEERQRVHRSMLS